MTLKENLMKHLLENDFTSAVINVLKTTGGETSFDIAEKSAQGAINENPTLTNVQELGDKAVELIVNELGW